MRATSLLAVGYLVLPSLNKGFIIIIIIITATCLPTIMYLYDTIIAALLV